MKTAMLWLKGLAAAFIGGAANSVTATVVAPEAFNLTPDGLKKIGVLALVSGGLSAATYLKKSPVPVKATEVK